jgi:pyrimidine deaminase RibD-like protein
MTDAEFLSIAIEKAKESVVQGGFPAGAIIVKDNQIIGEGISIGNQIHDPSSHGEMVAIRNTCAAIKSTDLSNAILYSSMQPCLMCFGASMWAAIPKIIYACGRDKVSNLYYGGDYKLTTLNQSLIASIQMEQIKELEQDSLKVIRLWETAA